MQFSLELPTQRVDHADEFVTGAAIAEVTRAARQAGFAAVNVTDHPAPDVRWLDAGGHHALDPIAALSFVAAADPAIKLHTNIFVAAYRNPFLAAKQIHSLQVLSQGRLLLGVAAGYLKPEFAALGIDFERRGLLLDDALAVLVETFDGGDVERSGVDYYARGVRLRPLAPAGRPPVWVGGNSRAAISRAARFEGWAPFHTGGYAKASRTVAIETLEDLAAAIKDVRARAAEAGARPFDVCWSEALLGSEVSADQRCSRIDALQTIGVSWVTITLPGVTRAELLDQIAAFGRDVISVTETGA